MTTLDKLTTIIDLALLSWCLWGLVVYGAYLVWR